MVINRRKRNSKILTLPIFRMETPTVWKHRVEPNAITTIKAAPKGIRNPMTSSICMKQQKYATNMGHKIKKL